jgi:hypothetical protein
MATLENILVVPQKVKHRTGAWLGKHKALSSNPSIKKKISYDMTQKFYSQIYIKRITNIIPQK